MLPEFGLINMNGRLYDPVLGRMLSPDNYVQMPDNTQNFNRYSYVLNNPLKYTDPSGNLIGEIGTIVINTIAQSMFWATQNSLQHGYNFHDKQMYRNIAMGTIRGTAQGLARMAAENIIMGVMGHGLKGYTAELRDRFSNLSITLMPSNDPDWNSDWGMIIRGDKEFKQQINESLAQINESLAQINQTGLGSHVLAELRWKNPYGMHGALVIRPASGTKEVIGAGGNGFITPNNNYSMGEIFFSGKTKLIAIASEAYNSDWTNLGHELWHAYQYNSNPNTFINSSRSSKERGAVRFENYLTSVFGINHVRTGYGGDTFFAGKPSSEFNVAQEYLPMTWTVGVRTPMRATNPNYNFSKYPLY